MTFGSSNKSVELNEKFYRFEDSEGLKLLKPNKEVMDKYYGKLTYGQDFAAIMAPGNKFDITLDDWELKFKNFNYPSFDKIAHSIEKKGVLPEIKETCAPLSHYFGRFIAKKNPEITVDFVLGKEATYFNGASSNHCLLDISHSDAINTFTSDPSFKVSDAQGVMLRTSKYDMGKTPLEMIEKERDFVIQNFNKRTVPLGFSHNLATTREAKGFLEVGNIENSSMMFMKIRNGVDTVFSLVQKPKGEVQTKEIFNWQKFVNVLEKGNPFRKFIVKVASTPGIKLI